MPDVVVSRGRASTGCMKRDFLCKACATRYFPGNFEAIYTLAGSNLAVLGHRRAPRGGWSKRLRAASTENSPYRCGQRLSLMIAGLVEKDRSPSLLVRAPVLLVSVTSACFREERSDRCYWTVTSTGAT